MICLEPSAEMIYKEIRREKEKKGLQESRNKQPRNIYRLSYNNHNRELDYHVRNLLKK